MTGLAALNYNRGRTAHSLFRIPVENNGDGFKCQIKLNSERAKLIQESLVVTWDELPMVQKGIVEAVDAFLHELCNSDMPFGGKIFIGIGNFCQVAPVVPRAGRMAIVLESIKSFLIWDSFEVCDLQQPIRDSHDPEYSRLMDDIGDGISDENINLPLLKITHKIDDAINFIFPETILNNSTACQKRAILSDAIDLYSTDNLANNDTNHIQQRNTITVELLNSFNTSGIPKHCLILKKVTIQNPTTGCIVHLPRITFLFQIPQFPFKISHHQFPLRLAYSSTFNSSQELTLNRVALDLRTPVFSYGQLYTALTRVRQRNHILILAENNYSLNLFTTKNVVYSELLE
ncbi:5407_t:CDS:2 [Cetraspora pellucida]|uniref:5407_t:CDS:1 n=1 Tax=Cetraspora pellucida TaxID=1433469 RepID=A0ACA9LS16_9GLOM|nr:5407_t:CDS:2 [Cetraspora pellucida]